MPSNPTASFFERHWRWFVLGALVFATFLNHLDRQTLSNAADPICQEFGLDNVQRGELLAKFVYYYAAAHLIVGPLVDRVRNFGLYVFGLGAWLANQQAFKQDVTRGRMGAVVGLVGFAETMLSAVLVGHVGKITQRTGAYGTVFIALAALFTIAVVMAMIFIRERWLPSEK